ncbi:MAG: hypothetical protein DRP71_16315 [Verrucomicrobia bacterium]|nr:MAG: hypothetical protein DRP71_16315 [Verrucomicrobiota bacterium]
MNLLDLIDRDIPAQVWTEGGKIPWNKPGFRHDIFDLEGDMPVARSVGLIEGGSRFVRRIPVVDQFDHDR